MNVPDKIMQNKKEITFNANKHIAYEDLQGIMRMLGWGIIVESGSNEYGEYMKFGNGWMVCTATVQPDRSITGASQTFPYPKKFIAVPSMSVSHYDGVNQSYLESCASAVKFPQLEEWRVFFTKKATAGVEYSMYLFAIGRWK